MVIKKYYLLLVLLLVNSAGVFAYDGGLSYIFNNQDVLFPIDKGVGVYIDETKELTITEIVKKQFQMDTDSNLNFGITDSKVWVKFQIKNQTEEENLFLMASQPSIDRISLYTLNPSGEWEIYDLGEYKPYNERFRENPNYIFPIHLPRNIPRNFYISMQSKDQLQTAFYIGNEATISHWEANRSIITGVYIGMILIMALYHIFIYYTVKNVSYIYYIFFILCVGLVQINFHGYAFKYLWPNSPFLALSSTFFVPMLSGLSTAFFVKKFLHTRSFTPKLDMGINIYIFLCICATIVGMSGFYVFGVKILQLIALAGAIYAMFVATVIMRMNYRPAKFFLIAFAVFFVCIIIFVLTNFTILIPYSPLSPYILMLGSIIQIVLLSFALADEINSYRKEKEASQAQALNTLKENERIIREQNVFLEKEVSKRTLDLSITNNDLQKSLLDLKQAQTQLIETEKLASLGMLTAGIAHEINNPINFVTSSVPPLRRDIDQTFQALVELERIGLSSSSFFDKKEEIEKTKENLEIDYIKEEIQSLLMGIEEGANRTAGIVKSLRIFSRVDEDDLKTADINLGMQSTLVIIDSSLKDTIKLKTNYGKLQPVECYPGKLNQVFLNLLTNASYSLRKKFGDQPGAELEVTTYQEGDFVYIQIKDNGTGIDEVVRTKIFDPFFTTKDVGEGTGLGLSIVYQTILKHRGEVIVNSTLGEGSEFTVKIPIKQRDT
jgi:two-component system NtrC family sensor kinase